MSLQKIHFTAQTPIELDQARLDYGLTILFSQYSRSQWQNWIKAGMVQIDGKVITKPRHTLLEGQTIEVNAELSSQTNWSAQDLPLTIVYEDDDLIVINKAAGQVVHPGAGQSEGTLVNALLNYDTKLQQLPRGGLIHRLDKDTSGLLVVARNLAAHNWLTQKMQEREIHREYLAIVWGTIISGNTIDEPIARHPRLRTQMAVVANGKPAVTHYRLLEKFRAHTYLQVELETGRTHQIRVHMTHIKHPLLGDPVYRTPTRINHKVFSDSLRHTLQTFKRQALHAYQLSVPHPTTHELMTWQAPIPADFEQLLIDLRADYAESRK